MNLGRLKAALVAFIEHVTARLDFAGLQAATVVSQNGDGTLEVRFENPRYGTLSKLKLLSPAPGSAVKVAAGARVMVGWIGCSRELPIAVAWDIGTTTELDLNATVIKLNGGSASVARVGDACSFALTAGPYTVTGTINISAGNATVKA